MLSVTISAENGARLTTFDSTGMRKSKPMPFLLMVTACCAETLIVTSDATAVSATMLLVFIKDLQIQLKLDTTYELKLDTTYEPKLDTACEPKPQGASNAHSLHQANGARET